MPPDASAWKAAIHESSHCSAAVQLGVPVRGASRYRDGSGQTWTIPYLDHDDLVESAIVGCEILLAPFLSGASGCGRDLRKVAQFESLGVPIYVARERCGRMIVTPEYRRVKWLFVDALMSKPELDQDDVRDLLAG